MQCCRLHPGQDLRRGIESLTSDHAVDAGVIVSCVGSLTHAQLRLADESQQLSQKGPFEIVSLVGTIGQSGLHLHISLADARGKVIGGHLLAGCPVHTTAEIVWARLQGVRFDRVFDRQTGFKELIIAHSESNS